MSKSTIDQVAVAFQNFFVRNVELAIDGVAEIGLWQRSADKLELELRRLGVANNIEFTKVNERAVLNCLAAQAQATHDMDDLIANVARARTVQAFGAIYDRQRQANIDDPDEKPEK